ncbi:MULTISPECIES: hypothetical protein [Paenibacillus]|nr:MULTISPECIES: hypothetical protein [Paenibacillus]ETT67236.1 hypothetical protein C171_04735 [Paenibacillus sp. FSL H8-237]OMD16194.1 hypothetical protein BJP47_21270 [Paenibacillus odorifer]OMD29730.1 hypothetical protein BJP48_16740 [Paenibacillus odorifer]OME29085.1 hypothetical protein BSK63_22460 [Paenibacillus odorifer]OME37785.1 hypothetical protein BSK58_20605 [Paenibacillus odorifer]
MPAYNDKALYQAADEDDAEYVEIESAFHGCKVTEGQIYRLERNYNNPQLFENGEAYVVDDETRENYAVFMLCKIALYK